jgi:hypothetical protein
VELLLLELDLLVTDWCGSAGFTCKIQKIVKENQLILALPML